MEEKRKLIKRDRIKVKRRAKQSRNKVGNKKKKKKRSERRGKRETDKWLERE